MRFLLIILSVFWFAFAQEKVVVYENPTCSCCKLWSKHLRENGFEVKEVKTNEWLQLKEKHKISQELQSCHTAEVEGYFLEGHIPAEDIKRLLEEKPQGVVGLSVPGMVIGSPGMEQGWRKESYKVYFIKKDGSTGVWAQH
ncbi:DUF411 domain-containing protein [Helicobacter enhydrae]|nr:DUF411 domain-containing protein [Helicobacter enhydrae]